jgi:polysaccharide export outer membrane protein
LKTGPPLANGPLFLQDSQLINGLPSRSAETGNVLIVQHWVKESVLHLSSSSGNKFLSRAFTVLSLLTLTAFLSGCEINDFVNPGEPHIVDPDTAQKPLVLPILDTLASGIEEPQSQFSSATDIEPADLIPDISDYKIGPNDLVSISIFDLLGEGTGEQVKTVRVTETGMVSLPFISPVKASGLTERELEDAVSKAYEDARLIRNARVSVTVEEARASTFSIQGNVGSPGEYQLTKPDFRMLDAMVTSHAPSVAIGVPYAYVIRKTTPSSEELTPSSPAPPPPSENPVAPPPSQPGMPEQPVPAPSQPATPTPTTAPGDLLAPPPTSPGPQGRANPSETSPEPQAMDDLPPPSSGEPFKFDDIEEPTDVRIIRVPIDQLRQYGELKYNIVIRPGDMIIVPDPTNGVYYLGGHVARPGVFGLTGERVTLKQAWVAAGGADDFAMPFRTEIVRRIGTNREVALRVHLDKILNFEEPDIFLKPNDVIYVGTDIFAPFIAAVRNSFRITYGAGFLYDQNFYNGVNQF